MTPSEQLNNCLNSVETLFNLYKDKKYWDRVYPQLVSSATQIESIFNTNQQLAFAYFNAYDAQRDYASNLLMRQSFIICFIAQLSGLNRIAMVKLIQSAISQLLTIRDILNTVSHGKKLTVDQRNAYQHRFRQSYVLFKSHLNKLPLIQTQLTSAIKQRPCYSPDYAIIHLAYSLAKQITPTKNYKGLSLRNSLAHIYLNTKQAYDNTLLVRLASIFNTPLPGESLYFEGNKYLVLGSITNKKLLCYDQVNNTHTELNNTLSVIDNGLTISKHDSAFYNTWSKLPDLKNVVSKPFHDEYFSRNDLNAIRKATDLSLGKLLNELNKNPNAHALVMNLSERVCDKPINDIRHAIALLGVEQLPDLLENQQLMQRLSAMGKVNWYTVESRIITLVKFIEYYKTIDVHFPCQKLINYALKYIAFYLKLHPYGLILSTDTRLPNARVNTIDTLLNFYTFQKVVMPDVINTNPFYQISTADFDMNNASPMQSACFLHLVLINAVFLGLHLTDLSAHLKQQLNIATTQLNIENLDNYLDNLLDISPVNSLF